MHFTIISYWVTIEAIYNNSPLISAQDSNPYFSPFCSLLTFLLILLGSHIQLLQRCMKFCDHFMPGLFEAYFATEFQKEPRLVRFTNQSVWVGVAGSIELQNRWTELTNGGYSLWPKPLNICLSIQISLLKEIYLSFQALTLEVLLS